MPDVAQGRQGAHPLAASLFPRCGNPACATGWMHLWRNRRVPVFEGRWACSRLCMRAMIALALQREGSGGSAATASWSHRVPIGLLLVEQGKISGAELRRALGEWRGRHARQGDAMRLGEWLVESGLLSPSALTQALSAQWSCPVFSLAQYRPEETASVMPRIFADAFGAVPVRVAGRVLYLAFCGTIDRSVSYAVERATGMRVTAGIAGDREFRRAQERYLATPGPRMQLMEAPDPLSLVRAIAARIERERPVEARLVRVHHDYWLRIWRRPAPEPGLGGRLDVEDLLCVLQAGGAQAAYRES